MNLPETIWWCPVTKSVRQNNCRHKGAVQLSVAGPDDLIVTKEDVEWWLRMASNGESGDLEATFEDMLADAQALAAAEGEE